MEVGEGMSMVIVLGSEGRGLRTLVSGWVPMKLGWFLVARTQINIDLKISNLNYSILCTHNDYFLYNRNDNSHQELCHSLQFQTFRDFAVFCKICNYLE